MSHSINTPSNVNSDVPSNNPAPEETNKPNPAENAGAAESKKGGQPAMDKKTRISPKQLSEQLYESRSSGLDLIDFTISEEEVPASVINYNRKLMNNAAKEIDKLKAEIAGYRHNLKTRTILENGRPVFYDEPKFHEIRSKKLRATANLIETKGLYAMYKEFYETGLEGNNQRHKKYIEQQREKEYLKRTVPSVTSKCMALVNVEGHAKVKAELTKAETMAAFRTTFAAFIKEHGNGMNEKFAARPKLLTKVVERVKATLSME